MADNEEIKGTEDDRPIKEPDEGIEELRAKLKEEQERRLAAEARERKLSGDLRAKDGEVHQTNQQIVESAIEKLSTDRDILKARYRAAREAGDIDAEIDANDALADVAAKLNQLQLGLKAMKEQPAQPAQAATRTGDPVEDLARGMEAEGHTRSAAWIRKHPEYARDPDMYREMIAAHNLATGRRFKLEPNTDDYFAKVEEILGINAAQRHEEHRDDPPPANGHDQTSTAARPVKERGADTPPPAAPPSRGGPGKGSVRLTAAQLEAAQISGLTPEEYAANLTKGKN